MTKFSFLKKHYLGVASGDFFEMTQQFCRAKPKKNSIYVGEYLSICLNYTLTMLWQAGLSLAPVWPCHWRELFQDNKAKKKFVEFQKKNY